MSVLNVRGINYDNDHLSIIYYRISLFYGYRDKDIQANAGMGKKESCFFRRAIILWVLF